MGVSPNTLIRRRFLRASLILALGEATGSAAQAPPPRRVGYLVNAIPAADLSGPKAHPLSAAFAAGLREAGWEEGRNLEILWRSAEGKAERRPSLIDEYLRAKVDVIVVSSNVQALEAKERTRQVPIVVVGLYSPVELGVVKSLARPGENVTGLAADTGLGLDGKRMSLLKQAAPKVSKVAVPRPRYASAENSTGFPGDEATLGLSLVPAVFDSSEDIVPAIEAAVRQGANAIFLGDYWDLNVPATRAKISTLATRLRLPTIYSAWWGQADGLLAYAPDLRENNRRAASYVDRILRGGNPAEMPIEQPKNLRLVINLREAKAIGLEIPPALLSQADHVIR